MSKNMFFTMLRDYISVASRRHMSLGAHIDALIEQYTASVKRSDLTEEQQRRAIASAREAIEREYVPVDTSYVLPAEG